MVYWSALMFCVLTVRGAMGSPGGAPASACDSMTPGHGFSVQGGPAPYTITPSSQTYNCGQSITVTLAATSGNFRGFLCQARTDVAAYSSTVGTLAQTGSVSMNENCGAGRALTHSENGDKSTAEFTWTPSADHGSVLIVCSIVQIKSTYWVKETSVALNYGGNCGTSAATPTGQTGSSFSATGSTVGMGQTTPSAAGHVSASLAMISVIGLVYQFM